MTTLNITDSEPAADDTGFSLNESSAGVTVDELSQNAMGGTEMMKYGLYERLPTDIRDEVQIICSRVREVDTHRPLILWLHDLFNDPEAIHLREEESRKRFDKLVFVSNWQFNTYHLAMGVPYSESLTLRNAIEPIPQKPKSTDDKIKLIYHTTPHRGLELLVPTFEFLLRHHDNIHLDVYSSFEAYGWPQRDEPYKELFERIKSNPNMTYHGYQPNEVVRKALQEAHIFAYPSIWQETSCIAAIEAMSAGCAIVCPNYAALPETTANFAYTYQWHEDVQQHVNIFANALSAVIDMVSRKDNNVKNRLIVQKNYTDSFYNWDQRAREWEGLIRGILASKA
jgi:UDP-glucose:(glucosyl)LPS alpha-1,2-glucosyltransferase